MRESTAPHGVMRRPSRRVAALLVGGTTVAMALALAPVPATAVSVISHDFTITTTQDPVTIEARYYRPSAPGTYPVVLFAHGGGGSVNSDAWRAHDLAQLGFVGVVWSARGHGNSGGLYDLFGPKTVQDTKDVLTWVLTNSAQTGADPARVGSAGYSQGGGTTNLAAALDPRIKVTAPGNTFSGLPESLKPNGCLKFSVDGVILGLAYTAMGARLDQDLVARWSAYLLSGINAPNPALGRPAPSVELEQRSPRNYAAAMTQPTFWIQSFDDPLFPIDQAVLMHRLQASPDNKLYLSWGGHFAPAQPDYEAKFREAQIYRWMQRWLQNDHNGIDTEPPVTWWSLAPNRHDIIPHASPTWPPPGLDMVPVDLVSGQAANLFGAQGTHDDPTIHFLGNTAGQGSVVQNLPAQTPIDTMITSTDPLAQDVTYAGSAHADIQWQSSGSPTQVDVKVWDIAPDGSATLLARGCTMAGGGPTGAATAAAFTGDVQLDLWHDAVEIPAGHRFQVWVQPADFPLWQPPAPAVVTMGQGSRVTLPLLASAPGSSLFQGHADHGPTTRLTLPNTSAMAGDAPGPGSITKTAWLAVTAGLFLMVPAALWTLARRRRD